LEQIRIGHISEDRREGSPFGKREEEATEAAELENRLAQEKRILSQLAAVDNALSKFDKGSYGNCENCGLPINPARLEALPEATLCLKCKAKLANNAKGR
jgi:RNA polymerase-binding transcription factor DksA